MVRWGQRDVAALRLAIACRQKQHRACGSVRPGHVAARERFDSWIDRQGLPRCGAAPYEDITPMHRD